VFAQIAQDEGERETKANGHDSKGCNRDCVRLLQPLAEHYIGWGKASFHMSCATTWAGSTGGASGAAYRN
jgi:hypothetical protein